MKSNNHFCLILLLVLTVNASYSQSGNEENLMQLKKVHHVHSIKATVIGLSYSYELPVTRRTVINFEPSLVGVLGSNFFSNNFWLITPVIRLEPRWYYNYLRRSEKGKKTINNSADFIALTAGYQPPISVGHNASALQSFSLIAKWGMKRAIGNHFFFGIAVGAGAYIIEGYSWKPSPGIDLKFGYAF